MLKSVESFLKTCQEIFFQTLVSVARQGLQGYRGSKKPKVFIINFTESGWGEEESVRFFINFHLFIFLIFIQKK